MTSASVYGTVKPLRSYNPVWAPIGASAGLLEGRRWARPLEGLRLTAPGLWIARRVFAAAA